MTEIGGMNLEMKSRKRKLHFNWDDVYQSSSEDEKNIIKKKVSSKEYSLVSSIKVIVKKKTTLTICFQLLEANFNLHATFQSSSEDEEDPKKVE